MKSKKRCVVTFVLLSVLLLGTVYFMVPTIHNIQGLKNLDEVTSMNDTNLKEGNYVKVPYECMLNAYRHHSVYWYDYNYKLIRLKGKEEYLYVAVHSDEMDALEGCDYIEFHPDSVGFVPKEEHYFIGKVEKNTAENRRTFANRIQMVLESKFCMVNTVDNTNLLFYINEMNIPTQKKILRVKVGLVAGAFLLWLLSLRKMIKQKKENAYGNIGR